MSDVTMRIVLSAACMCNILAGIAYAWLKKWDEATFYISLAILCEVMSPKRKREEDEDGRSSE